MNDVTGGGATGADESPEPNSSIRIVALRSRARSLLVERRQCPACGALASDRLLALPFADDRLAAFMRSRYPKAKDLHVWLEGGSYQLERCGECRLVFQRYVASSDLGSLLHDEWLGAHSELPADARPSAAPHASPEGQGLYAVASALGKPVSDLRVLEYGRSSGDWARSAKALGAQAFSYVVSEAGRERARQNGIQVAPLRELDQLRADFVNADEVLERAHDPVAALSELTRALAPHGILKLGVSRAADIERRLRVLDWSAPPGSRDSLRAVYPLEQVNCFDWPALEAVAARAGLRRISVPLRAYAAVLRVPGAVSWRRPSALAEALARPLQQRLSRSKLHAWFVRAGG